MLEVVAMKEELRLFLVCLWVLTQGNCIPLETKEDLSSLGWKEPRDDFVDYFNFTADIKSKRDRYPELPYDRLDRIPTGLGVWGLLHNEIPGGWAQDPNSFQIPQSVLVDPAANVHLRFFLHGDAFIQVMAGNKVEGMITIDNPCGNSCRPKFRERIIKFTTEAPIDKIIVRMNTTNKSDVVLIDSITLDYEGDVVEEEDYFDDECECKLTTLSGDLGESSAFEEECLSTLDNQSDDDWTSPDDFYFESISEVPADVLAEIDLERVANKSGIWAFGIQDLGSQMAAFSHNSSQAYFESVNITAIVGGTGSIFVVDVETLEVYSAADELEGDDGWSTFLIDFDPMSTVKIIVNVTEVGDFVLIDKIVAYGSGCEVTGTTDVTPPVMCDCTTVSSTSTTIATENTTPSPTTKQAGTTTTESPELEKSSLSTSSEPSNPNTTSTKPPVETTTPDGASLVQPFVLMVIIPLLIKLAFA